jgi:hypothetical protein
VFCPESVFRIAVDPGKRRNSRWRGMLRAKLAEPLEPYEFQVSTYAHLSCDAPRRLGSFSVAP